MAAFYTTDTAKGVDRFLANAAAAERQAAQLEAQRGQLLGQGIGSAGQALTAKRLNDSKLARQLTQDKLAENARIENQNRYNTAQTRLKNKDTDEAAAASALLSLYNKQDKVITPKQVSTTKLQTPESADLITKTKLVNKDVLGQQIAGSNRYSAEYAEALRNLQSSKSIPGGGVPSYENGKHILYKQTVPNPGGAKMEKYVDAQGNEVGTAERMLPKWLGGKDYDIRGAMPTTTSSAVYVTPGMELEAGKIALEKSGLADTKALKKLPKAEYKEVTNTVPAVMGTETRQEWKDRAVRELVSNNKLKANSKATALAQLGKVEDNLFGKKQELLSAAMMKFQGDTIQQAQTLKDAKAAGYTGKSVTGAKEYLKKTINKKAPKNQVADELGKYETDNWIYADREEAQVAVEAARADKHSDKVISEALKIARDTDGSFDQDRFLKELTKK